MKIEDVIKEQDNDKRIKMLTMARGSALPDTAKNKREWDVEQHDVMIDAPDKRPNKKIKVKRTNAKGEQVKGGDAVEGSQPVVRIGIAMQQLIVKRAVAFAVGNPIQITSNKSVESKVDDETIKKDTPLLTSIKKILEHNKVTSFDRDLCRNLFSNTEVAEYWYATKLQDGKKNKYQFKTGTDQRIRCKIFAPFQGDKLFPFFDDEGDFKAFSREFQRSEIDNSITTYFETWTDDQYYLYKKMATDEKWSDPVTKTNPYKKIPIIYSNQGVTDWSIVQPLIKRLEFLLSNHGDTNDYHAAPKIFVNGNVTSFGSKGESGQIIQGDANAKAAYLAWQQAPDAVKLEIDTLFRLIFMLTQTPDISFEGLKNLGEALSGSAMKKLFIDAYLKVMEHREVLDEHMERRLNVLTEIVDRLGGIKPLEDEELKAVFMPYEIADAGELLGNLTIAVNGKILSRKTAVMKNPLVDDAEAELRQIKAEEEEAREYELDRMMNAADPREE